jgi:hypothetical protein
VEKTSRESGLKFNSPEFIGLTPMAGPVGK